MLSFRTPLDQMKTSLGVLAAVFLCSSSLFAQSNSLSEKLKQEPLAVLAADAKKWGDPTRGALAFYQPTMNCAKCHEPAQGRRLGPDLAQRRIVKFEYLVESILKPSAQIREGYETVVVQMADGRLLSGIKIGQLENRLIIDRIEQAGEPLSIDLDEVDEWKPSAKSTMPEDLAEPADRPTTVSGPGKLPLRNRYAGPRASFGAKTRLGDVRPGSTPRI